MQATASPEEYISFPLGLTRVKGKFKAVHKAFLQNFLHVCED